MADNIYSFWLAFDLLYTLLLFRYVNELCFSIMLLHLYICKIITIFEFLQNLLVKIFTKSYKTDCHEGLCKE